MTTKHPDVIIVGGGLSGCLTAWLLAQQQELDVLLLERGSHLGGNHTWSFFKTDLSAVAFEKLKPLISTSWPGYTVKFPSYSRHLDTPYHSIASDYFATAIAAALGQKAIVNANVVATALDSVTLACGTKIQAPCIIDARGNRSSPHLILGYQKFLGLEVRLPNPHSESRPVIMDATVPQGDGYRFVYTLPLSPNRLLIEDTYYSDDMDLPVDTLRRRIEKYAGEMGWNNPVIERQEQGVLPILLAGDIESHLNQEIGRAPKIGLAATLFHPTTGYSLPDAIHTALRLAEHFAANHRPTTQSVRLLLDDHVRATWRERSYFRLLNRMMFKAGRPNERYRILERFYRLDADLMQRFYAARLTIGDRMRILAGRPPVPILSALSCVSERQMLLKLRKS
jgi:lycopene beta-cyclase